MTYIDLQAIWRYVRTVQKIIHEPRGCLTVGCDNCDYAYICELTNCLLKFIQHEINKYDEKGESKDDNN